MSGLDVLDAMLTEQKPMTFGKVVKDVDEAEKSGLRLSSDQRMMICLVREIQALKAQQESQDNE